MPTSTFIRQEPETEISMSSNPLQDIILDNIFERLERKDGQALSYIFGWLHCSTSQQISKTSSSDKDCPYQVQLYCSYLWNVNQPLWNYDFRDEFFQMSQRIRTSAIFHRYIWNALFHIISASSIRTSLCGSCEYSSASI